MLYADQKTYLVELLMKQDRMSMACSIESRVPFLDHHFLEFAMSIPDNLKIRGATQKYILKKAVEDLIPAEIIHRKKMGFPNAIAPMVDGAAREALLNTLRKRDGLLAAYVGPSGTGSPDRTASQRTDRRDRSVVASVESSDVGRRVSDGDRATRSSVITGGAEPRMKMLWAKADFLHPTDRGGQIRTLEMLKRLHTRHEIHYVALELAETRAAPRSTVPARTRLNIACRRRTRWHLGVSC